MKLFNKTVLFFVVLLISLVVEPIACSKTLRKRAKRVPGSLKKSSRNLEQKESKFSGSWKLSLGASTIEDEITKGTATNMGASMKLDYKFMESVKLHAEPRVSFKSGQAQSLYGEYEPKNSFGVDEAIINIKPHNLAEFNVGILGHYFEKRIGNPHLVSGAPFPGIEAKLNFIDNSLFSLGFALEEAIPTSYTFDSEVDEMEETPRFHVQSVFLKVGKEESVLRSTMTFTRFSFDNLPSVVAQKSRTRGNTVTDSYNFDYEFKGYSFANNNNIDLSNNFILLLGGTYLSNSEAPSGLNKQYTYGAGISYKIQKGIKIVPRLVKFYTEPDAVPAYYSGNYGGLNNRQGYIYKVALELKDYNLKISGDMMDSDLIYRSSIQAKRRTYGIKLETLDVEF